MAPALYRHHPTHLRLGYVPMLDAAPLIVAEELGYFRDRGLSVELIREPGWATIREKIFHGELHAAQAPASMVLELSEGLSGIKTPCLTAFVTAHHGNAISLSQRLWDQGVRDGGSLAEHIKAHPNETFRFAGVLRFSSQHYLMRHWLLSHGIKIEKNVEMVIVPPPLVHESMKSGYLDGYCVAEPWSSLGISKGTDWCVELSSNFAPGHIEKVFLLTEKFHQKDAELHYQLIHALKEAAEFCDLKDNRHEVCNILSKTDYLDVSPEILANALVGPFHLGHGRHEPADDVILFHQDNLNRPTLEKSRWLVEQMSLHRLIDTPLDTQDLRRCFREDIYNEFLSSIQKTDHSKPNHN